MGNFLEAVTEDEGLKEIIRNNKEQNPDVVYNSIIREKLKDKLENIVIEKSPELYETITGDNVMPFINKTAYTLIRRIALFA